MMCIYISLLLQASHMQATMLQPHLARLQQVGPYFPVIRFHLIPWKPILLELQNKQEIDNVCVCINMTW